VSDDDLLPGLRATALCLRVAFGVFAIAASFAVFGMMQCSSTTEEQLRVEREQQGQRTDAAWRRVRADRTRRTAVVAALGDTLRVVWKSAAALDRAIREARAARDAIMIGEASPAIAGDTVKFLDVTRVNDPRIYTAPAFLVDAGVKTAKALDSAVRQLARKDHALELADQALHLDSVTFGDYEATVASLRDELVTADKQTAAAARAGWIRGLKIGAAITGTLAILEGVLLLCLR
jgi:hypothetical protein